MHFSFFSFIRPLMVGAFGVGLLSGCDEWPRYKNKPSIDAEALEPGTDPASGVTMDWITFREDAEPNNAPTEGSQMNVGDGLVVSGSLEGLGWDPGSPAERLSECGGSLAFPPSTPGDYTGDVDWIAIDPNENGLLCLTMMTEHPTARIDVSLYVLDECGEAVGVFVHPNSTEPIGANLPAAHTGWAVAVDDTLSLAIGIAGFWPDDQDLTLEWTAAVSMVPSVAGSADALCPEVP